MLSKRCHASKFCGQLPSPKADAALPADLDVAIDGEDHNAADTLRYQAVLKAPRDDIGPEAEQQFACVAKADLCRERRGEIMESNTSGFMSLILLEDLDDHVTAINAHAWVNTCG